MSGNFSKVSAGGSGIKAVRVNNTSARLALTLSDVSFGDTVIQRVPGNAGGPQITIITFSDWTSPMEGEGSGEGGTDDISLTIFDVGASEGFNANLTQSIDYPTAAYIAAYFTTALGICGFASVTQNGSVVTVTNDNIGSALPPNSLGSITPDMSTTAGSGVVIAGSGSGDGVYTVVDASLLGDAAAFIKCG